MNRIEDERVRFFLEHEERIREWAALKDEVSKFVHRFYRSLKGDLDAALKSGRIAEDGVRSFRVGGKWPGLGLRREGWPTGKDDPDVRLEWFRKSALFPPSGSLYCGVRTNVESTGRPSPTRLVPPIHDPARGGQPIGTWILLKAGTGRVTTSRNTATT